MDFIVRNIKWLMLVSGGLTATMLYGLFAPQAALEMMFGASFGGTLETLVARSWSALVGLMGAVLIYGALSERHRVFAITIAAVSKTIFVSLVLLYGRDYLDKVGPAIVMDSVVIACAAAYLVALRLRS